MGSHTSGSLRLQRREPGLKEEEYLLELFREKALLRGEFVLASGRTSDFYIDARRVTLSAEGSRLIGVVLFQRLLADPPDAVAGMSMGADPVVTAVTVVSAQAGRPIDGLLIRKQAKDHGTGKLIEGSLVPGMKVVVVEDTSTTARPRSKPLRPCGRREPK